jgi:serine/threonine protein kinase
VRGDVKIFDLGLAKELNGCKDNGDGTYQLTGDTGSPRYMATEG